MDGLTEYSALVRQKAELMEILRDKIDTDVVHICSEIDTDVYFVRLRNNRHVHLAAVDCTDEHAQLGGDACQHGKVASLS